MTIRYDLQQPATDVELVAVSLDDVAVDVGRKFTYDPGQQLFTLRFASETRTVDELKNDAQVRFYLQTHGQNPTAKSEFADLDFVPIEREEINW